MPRGANIGRRTRHASQQQVYSQNLSEERQNIIRENAPLRQRIQGQIYHLHGSMVPTPDEPHQFLQIYFISSMVDQLNVRCNIQGAQQLKRRIIEQLQTFFHANNALVNMFKTALERMPSDTHKFVITADCTPTGEHVRRFNAPTVNDVAAIIVGGPTKSRDIVVQRRSNIMHRVNETHRLYDALQ
ncbi:hypothetical protein EVAR_59618_1 [Eumeta japonica]|uniref:Helitron helicase-like domain-containing protein n=1 Tax=Eumeta variegata TaxID=151549 RepID=A0A4C1Z7W1_EUMVA|nr:hypothetical protein EVAR_59618_1 [Eumeta japonica]